MENPLEWDLQPEYNEVEETGRYLLTTVVREGNYYVAEEKAIAFGNCYQCFRAGPLGIACPDCGSVFRNIYFVPQPGMWGGQGFEQRLLAANRQSALPFSLGADYAKKALYINIDARVYDQGVGYVHDPYEHSIIMLGDLYHVIDMWNGNHLDAQMMTDMEREIRLVTQTHMSEVEWAVDQYPGFREGIRTNIDYYRRMRNEHRHPFIQSGVVRFSARRIGPVQPAAPQQQVRQLAEETDDEQIAQEPVPPQPANNNDDDSDEQWA